MADEAEAAISRVAGPADILETRLQGAATSMFAFAKTAKMETSTAMTFMEDALQAAADSAAYYDRSLEDTSATLQSFLKGNYENDAALGLSATEATRNAKAMEMYGKSFNSLTEAQKQLALLEMVKDANRLSGAMGQAAREADGWENVTGNLTEAWRQLMAAVGQPLLRLAVPVVQQMTNALTQMAAWANNAYSALAKVFGWQEQQTAAIDAAADAQDGLTAAVEATEEAQEGALAGFDEIEVLASSAAESAQTSSGVTAAGGELTLSAAPETMDTAQTEKINQMTIAAQQLELALRPIKQRLQELWSSLTPLQSFSAQALFDFRTNFLEPVGSWVLGEGLSRFLEIVTNGFNTVNWESLNQALAGLFVALAPFTINIGEGLLWLLENIFVPFGVWVLNEAAPVFITMLSEAFETLNLVYEKIKPGLEWIWNEWLKPVAEWTGGQIIQIMEDFTKTFQDMQSVINGDMTISDLIKNMSDVEIVMLAVAAAVGLVSAAIVWYNACAAVYNAVTAIAAAVTGTLTAPITIVIAAIAALIAIILLCVKHWDEIKAAAIAVWDGIVETFKNAADWFNENVIEPIASFFSGLWSSIKTGFIKLINKIIDGINEMIEGFLSPINGLIEGWNSSIGKVAGEIPTIEISIPKIPLPALATGAVIPPNREFLAVLGDQTSGTNIETPLETMIDAFRTAMREYGGTGGSTTVILQVDKRELGRAVVELGRKEERRIGTRLVTS